MVRIRRWSPEARGTAPGGHDGDMAPLFLDSNGRAEATFTTEGIDANGSDGRVVTSTPAPTTWATSLSVASPTNTAPTVLTQ